MEFLYFFGDRFEVFEDGVGGGLERSKGLHHYCPSVFAGMGGCLFLLTLSLPFLSELNILMNILGTLTHPAALVHLQEPNQQNIHHPLRNH
jgi:hypothetical protein